MPKCEKARDLYRKSKELPQFTNDNSVVKASFMFVAIFLDMKVLGEKTLLARPV